MARATMAASRSPRAAAEATAIAFASQSVTVSAPATAAQPSQPSIAPAAATVRRAGNGDRVYFTDSVSFMCPPVALRTILRRAAMPRPHRHAPDTRRGNARSANSHLPAHGGDEALRVEP